MPNQFTVALWGDEGFSAILSMKSIPEIIRIIARDTSPPLYNITEHLAFVLWGTDETIIRGLSFAYYLIAIFFTYKIGEFLWGRRIGLTAAVLTFLNPFFFIYAFEGRMYSILAAGVTASMYFFIKLVFAKKMNQLDWYGYIAASLVALYSHHFAVFALLVQGLWFLTQPNRKMFKAFLLIGLGYLPWLVPLYQQTQMVGSGFWLGQPSLKDLLSLIGDYLGKGTGHPFGVPAMTLVTALLLLRNWNRKVRPAIFLLFWFLLPILATWGISQIFQSVFFNRYLIYSIPPAMLLVVSQRKGFATALLILALGFYAVMARHYFLNPTKDPFDKLAEYVRENKRGDDFIVHGDAGNHQLWESKYYGIPAPIYVPQETDLPFFVGTALMEEDDIINKLPPKIRRVGVITKSEVAADFLPNYTKDEVATFGTLRFTWFIK